MSDSTKPTTTSDASSSAETVTINVKAPSDVKLTLKVNLSSTVLELKQQIASEKEEYSADSLRLIWSGRVLKDEDVLSKYGLKEGNTIHLVKGNRSNAPATSSGPTSSAAAGVPSNVAAGQQFMGNPLAPLMNAQNAGALGGFNPFADMGINPNDPNYMQTMMRDPAVQEQVNSLLQNPQVLDQIIQSNPQLSAMGPQVRQIMQSEQFRQFFTNPDAMNQMMQMMGGAGGPFGGMGAGGMPAPGGTAQGQQQQRAGGGLYNPWASTTPSSTGDNNNNSGSNALNTESNPSAAGAAGAFNPFAAMGGAGAGPGAGGMPDFQTMMQQMQQLQQLQQMFGSGGGMFGGAAGGNQQSQQNQVPPEERYQAQLEQLAGMGFHDAAKNLRALMASGGNVEAAVEYLFSMP